MNNMMKNKESEVKASRLLVVCIILLFLSVGVRAVIIGGKDGGYYNGTIDEVRIWNREVFVEQNYYSNLNRYSTSGWSFYSNQSNLSLGDYTYQGCAEDSSGNLNCTEVRSLEIEAIVEEAVPVINEVKCYDSTSWIDCLDMGYGINMTQIRVNCTDVNDDIANVSYLMTNLDDNDVKIDGNASYMIGDYWYYNYNEFILDSGDWSLNISCSDGLFETNYSESWSLAYGVLEPYIVSGNMDVAFNTSFEFTVGVRCAGGECGDVNATLDPIEILKLGHSVNVPGIEKEKIGIVRRLFLYLMKLANEVN